MKFLIVPKGVVNAQDLVQFIMKRERLTAEKAFAMIVPEQGISRREFSDHQTIIAKSSFGGIAAFRLSADETRHVQYSPYFAPGMAVALREAEEKDMGTIISEMKARGSRMRMAFRRKKYATAP